MTESSYSDAALVYVIQVGYLSVYCIFLFFYLSIDLYIYRSVLSIHQSIYLYIYPSTIPSINLSFNLSI